MGKAPLSQGKGDRDRVKNLDAYRDGWTHIFAKTKPSPAQSVWDTTMTPALKATRKPLVHCAAARDGECFHPDCPQIRDDEPEKTGRHCPLDYRDPYEEAV